MGASTLQNNVIKKYVKETVYTVLTWRLMAVSQVRQYFLFCLWSLSDTCNSRKSISQQKQHRLK